MAARTARQKAASRKNLIQARKSKGGKGIAGGLTHNAPGAVRQPYRSKEKLSYDTSSSSGRGPMGIKVK